MKADGRDRRRDGRAMEAAIIRRGDEPQPELCEAADEAVDRGDRRALDRFAATAFESVAAALDRLGTRLTT